MSDKRLKSLVLSGSSWALARTAFDQVLRFGVFVALARILTPTDFGIFALATIFVDIGRILATAGWAEAVVRSDDASDDYLSTIFWSIFGLSISVGALIALLSVPIATVIHEPKAGAVILVLSALLLLTPLAAVHSALATKAFKNKQLAGAAFVTGIVGSASVIACAMVGLGVWSFVIQQAVTGTIGAGLMWMIVSWRPRLQFNITTARSIFGFSTHLVVAQLLQTGVVRVQDLIAGAAINPGALGQYRIAGRGYEIINQVLIMPLSQMAMPALSRLQSDHEAFKRTYLRMLSLTSLFATPAMLGFALVAPIAVPLIFGDKWLRSVPVVQILGLLAPAMVIAYFAAPALVAKGRSDTVLRLTAIQFAGTVVFSLVGVRWGITGLAWAYVLRSYFTMPVQLHLFAQATGVSIREVLARVLPPLLPAIPMAISVVGLNYFVFPAFGLHPGIALAALCLAGGTAYLAGLLLLIRRFTFEQVASVRSIISNRA